MNVAFYTLGCKVNTYESEALQNMFVEEGFKVVDFNTFADVYIINTCTVTNQSDAKSRKTIRQAVKRNPDAIVAVMGCYSQVDSETVAAIDGVDIVIGTTHRAQLLDYVKRFMRERKKILEVNDITRYKTFDQLNVTSFAENTRAFLKIQDGCNQYCSYCIIPFARGPIRSRDPRSVLEEARLLVNKGYQEIVLTGIHTGGYGTDLENFSFYDLLKALSEIKGLKRLRISSIEINQLTDEILTLMHEHPIFVKHLHVPLQSGSDAILRKMKRRYTLAEYEAKIASFRKALPGVAITTDIIVGYPEETDEDFEAIKATINRVKFSEMHVFPYSKRSGTKAAQIKDQVHGTIKSMRVNELMAMNETLANAYIESIKDETQSVLFERCDGNYCKGHTSNYVMVKVKTDEQLENQIHAVKILSAAYPESEAVFV